MTIAFLPNQPRLLELQKTCCVHVFASHNFRNAPGALTSGPDAPPREGTALERSAVHAVVEQGVLWFVAEKPDRLSRKAYERYCAAVAANAERAIEQVCGVGILIGALLSWLIGQALSWLWNWWRETRNAPELVCGMVS